MKDLSDLQKRALEIRAKYEKFETQKYGQPWTRERLVQGFSKDVTDLLEITSAPHLDSKKLRHELADCLWSVLIIAKKYDVDLGDAFLATMNELDERLDKELL